MPDFIPAIQAQRMNWLANFNTKVQADIAGLGVPAASAASLNTTYTALAAAWAVVEDPDTRTTPAINAKDQAMVNCVRQARIVAAIIQAMPTVTDEQRLSLGLPVHDTEPTPVPPPNHAPNITNLVVNGRVVSGRLTDATDPDNRGRPLGVGGAVFYSHIGEAPPASLDGWKIEGITTRTRFQVLFPATVEPGTQVWITAAWRNFTDEVGPAAVPQTLNLGAGNAQAA